MGPAVVESADHGCKAAQRGLSEVYAGVEIGLAAQSAGKMPARERKRAGLVVIEGELPVCRPELIA